MSPLRLAERATLSEVVGVVFDLDDTLTTHGSLTAEAYASLFRLRDAGLAAIVVTGRPLGWTDAMAATWPVALAVGENGAGWARREGRGLATGCFASDARLLEREALRREVSTSFSHLQEADDQPARRCDVAWDIAERRQVPAADVDALLALIEARGARALASSVHVHAAFGEWDKASGVRHAAREAGLALDPAQWIFVGDSGNDAAAFAHFPLSVGVANVRAHLSRLPIAPRWVTEAERGAGFVELVDALLEARLG